MSAGVGVADNEAGGTGTGTGTLPNENSSSPEHTPPWIFKTTIRECESSGTSFRAQGDIAAALAARKPSFRRAPVGWVRRLRGVFRWLLLRVWTARLVMGRAERAPLVTTDRRPANLCRRGAT
jgi:hypothetical protein